MAENIQKIKLIIFGLAIFFGIVAAKSADASGASLYLAPSQGSFLTGSTFDISLFVDTKGNEINVVEAGLKFSPDILQIADSTSGESFISEWTTPPNYSNMDGTISFKGGISQGIITSAGLISKITFRAKSAGMAKIEFLDSSKLLLKDGKGTAVQTANIGGVYEILVSPPDGPKIISLTHPDQEKWYGDSSPSFSWVKDEDADGFSFSFSQNFQEIPDTVSEGTIESKFYNGTGDGVWYFHLRASKKGIWGKTSHFSVKIDASPPLEFIPDVDLSGGFIYFETKDIHSGISYREISMINLDKSPNSAPFFIETTSPFKIASIEYGKYQVAVRVYDNAGNLREGNTNFQFLSPFVSLVRGGFK